MVTPRRRKFAFLALCVSAAAGLVAGCERNDMMNQPRHEPLEQSDFFADKQSSRPIVPGTIARGTRPFPELVHCGTYPSQSEALAVLRLD